MTNYDLSQFDILDLLASAGVSNIRKKGRDEYMSSCPACGGNDRLHVHPKGGKVISNPYAQCRQCNKTFDAIGLTMIAQNTDFKGAISHLGLSDSTYTPRPKIRANKPIKPVMVLADEHERDGGVNADIWQARATAFCLDCHDFFANGKGDEARQARDYIHNERVLEIHITDSPNVRLGYNPTAKYEAGNLWGLGDDTRVWLPKGFIIPYWQNERVIRIKARPHDGKPSKYIGIKGGASEAVYIVGTSLAEADSAIMLEGEYDALALWQAIPRPTSISIIATGSTQGGRYLSLATELASVPHVWLAFDDDEAGRGASEAWITQILHAQRLAPLAHDINDMLITQGAGAIVQWLKAGGVNVKPIYKQREGISHEKAG